MVLKARFLSQRLQLRHLRLIDALDRTGALSEAARLLGVSQPAASKTLQDMEAVTGARMFERGPRGVTSTAAGAVVIDHAQRILASYAHLDEELDRLDTPGGGRIVIGALPVAAAGLVWPVMQALAVANSGLEIRVEEGRVEGLTARLLAGDIEMILGRLYEPDLPDGFIRAGHCQVKCTLWASSPPAKRIGAPTPRPAADNSLAFPKIAIAAARSAGRRHGRRGSSSLG